MKKHSLSAKSRDVVGRKVKNLRRQGLLPGTVYGKKVKSASVSVALEAFSKVYKEAGESGLVELSLDKDARPVLIHNVQLDPVRGTPIHVEFFQVDLKEKVQTKVPVEFVGEPAAVANKTGVLLTITDEVEVEALPTDLPEKLIIDVVHLAEVDQEVKVKDLKSPSGVTILADSEQTLAKIGALVSKEAEKLAAEEAAAAAAAAAEKVAEATPAEGASEAPAAEGPEPATETKPEEKKEEEKKG